MKTFLQAWWRGIGVLGLYLCFSIVMGIIYLVAEALPERLQLTVGLPMLVLVAPPALYWTFRWIYPEVAAAKSRFSEQRGES
jgi:Na+/melibiose symporter-like transporter